MFFLNTKTKHNSALELRRRCTCRLFCFYFVILIRCGVAMSGVDCIQCMLRPITAEALTRDVILRGLRAKCSGIGSSQMISYPVRARSSERAQILTNQYKQVRSRYEISSQIFLFGFISDHSTISFLAECVTTSITAVNFDLLTSATDHRLSGQKMLKDTENEILTV